MQQIIARILLLGLLLARISSQYVSSITLQGIVILLSSRFFVSAFSNVQNYVK